jgi:hypothetical protein
MYLWFKPGRNRGNRDTIGLADRQDSRFALKSIRHVGKRISYGVNEVATALAKIKTATHH